jgi:hypothetical protein
LGPVRQFFRYCWDLVKNSVQVDVEEAAVPVYGEKPLIDWTTHLTQGPLQMYSQDSGYNRYCLSGDTGDSAFKSLSFCLTSGLLVDRHF